MEKGWKYPLFGCLSQQKLTCCLVCCYPCTSCYVTYQNFQSLQDSETGVFRSLAACFLPCLGHAWNRGTIRENYSIEGNFIQDLIPHLFCNCCALIQEYNEIHTAPSMLKTKKNF